MIEAEYPAGFPGATVGSTKDNLLHAAHGENMEHSSIYPEFAKIADEEGFPEIAKTWLMISNAEKYHETRYRALAKNVEDGKVFSKDAPTTWRCINCGYNHEGSEAPDVCPACKHAKAYFELLCICY